MAHELIFLNGVVSLLYVEPYLVGEFEVNQFDDVRRSGGTGGVLAFGTPACNQQTGSGHDVGREISAGYDSGNTAQFYDGLAYGQFRNLDWLVRLTPTLRSN